MRSMVTANGFATNGGLESFFAPLADEMSATGDSRIIDLTAQADKMRRIKTRDPKQVYALVLHQMACCFNVRDPLTRFLKMAPHFAILPDGRILQLHPILALTGASNGFNPGSVAVEFAGNFPDTSGKWWHGVQNGRNQVTPAQIEAGRYLVRYLIRAMGLKVILAHRQSSGTRDNDPGPDIWYQVGQWAIDNLGLKDGGPGFKTGSGKPIPDLWRNWGRRDGQSRSNLSQNPPAEVQRETRKGCRQDLCDPNYVRWVQRSLNRVLGLQLIENGNSDPKTRSAIRSFQTARGLNADSSVGPITRQALLAAGASQPPQMKDLPCGPTSGPDLAKLLNKYRGDIPLHFLLGWIEIESGRRIDSSTYLCERGYFQIHPDQSKDRGWSHELLSFNPDYSIKRGVEIVSEMVRQTEKLATKYGLSKGSDAFWGMVKIHHWIPSAPAKILEQMSRDGKSPTSWAAIMQYIVSEKRRIPALGHWNPIDGAMNADKTLKAAEKWKTTLPNNGELEFEEETGGFYEIGQPSSSATPPLIKEEVDPPGKSLYVKIPLGSERPAIPMTGIFCPANFQPRPQVDLIIYLHGIKPRADLSVDRYWNRKYYAHFALREGLNESSKNAILVWPTLGPRSQSQVGWLTNPGGLDKFVDQVLAALAAYGPYQRLGQKPGVGNIILACHSGGGLPMRKLALAENRYGSQIKECWGFDCLYFGGDETLWPQWVRKRPDAKLFIHYQYTTRTRSEKLAKQGIPNISVSRSSAKGHNWVPIHHWRERLQAAPLQSRTQANGARSSSDQKWGWGSIGDWFKPSGPGEMEFETARPKKRKGPGTDCGRSGAPAALVSQPGGRCIGPTPPVCPSVTGILSLQSIGNIPFEYVDGVGRNPSTSLVVVTRRLRPRTQRFLPAVQTALTQFIANMNRFGMQIEAILTAGSYCCRCISRTNRLSNHSSGHALDLVGVRWASSGGRETIMHNWNSSERPLLRRINACLRLSFATVLDYYVKDHQDHFHCDTPGRARNPRGSTTLKFAQEALSVALGRTVPTSGKFDAATQTALIEFAGATREALRNSAQLNEILDRLFTRIAADPSTVAQPAAAAGLTREMSARPSWTWS